ncbi:hypothetical protein [Rhodoferax mekongensis]|uniref:hypothetical protein n=1 Tax=Rhodoferax mekongensis TaxID=3068341 RepID=UPI0028BE8A87|nr:hypothetical protein [Rhodoferax sp. TBRC 17199]MDT7515675.1 hypothetical protein [Rhodoferax sp. TBRC 17199]NBX21531.1 hypothetical protein [Betaproteobacteria bacterium]
MQPTTTSLKLAVVVSVLCLGGFAVYLAPLQPSVVALQLTFTPDAFARVLQAWGPEGVQRFRHHLPIDGLLLCSYGAAGYLAVARTRFFESLKSLLHIHGLALLLPAAAALDAAENLLHWVLTGADAGVTPASAAWYLAAGICASLKWAGIAAFAFATVLAWRRR